ncbi:hypothetical protein BpHYR1_039519 [Brachionus plicatilis]|uniref:Uncharacterized protein n=1 Tax=Brachionus plicatilis TaxID=10195 RepID=A0A3M7R2N0_BRAPC|nr:hypothetical protein BpHYR1_039519 [Brachionus plicatilis]
METQSSESIFLMIQVVAKKLLVSISLLKSSAVRSNHKIYFFLIFAFYHIIRDKNRTIYWCTNERVILNFTIQPNYCINK